MVSRTPQALSCCTARLGSNLPADTDQRCEQMSRATITAVKQVQDVSAGHHVDSREGQLVVVGFDAAHVMWGGCVQSLHQHLQRITELKGRK